MDRAEIERGGEQAAPAWLAGTRALWYGFSMAESAKDILRRVQTWPVEDQEELLEMARAIEARRTGVYFLSEDEQGAIDAARRTAIVSDEKVRAFWERFGIA